MQPQPLTQAPCHGSALVCTAALQPHRSTRSKGRPLQRRLHHHHTSKTGSTLHTNKRSSLIKRRALEKGEGRKASKQVGSSSKQQQQQADASSIYSWWSRLPGDSGWDWFKLRTRDEKTFNRFREAEVIHARWAMLGVISVLLSDVAGSPFPPKQMTWSALAPWGVVVLLCLGFIETYRLAALWDEEDFEKRAYPGKRFDFLGFTRPKSSSSSSRQDSDASSPEQQLPGFGVFAPWLGGLAGWLAGGWWFDQREMTKVELLDMKSRELRNGRLAMVSFIGCCLASALTGKGPITLLFEHLSDPVHNTIVQTLQ